MNTYLFKTSACVKPCDYKKWWVDRKVIGDFTVQSDSFLNAIAEFAENCNGKGYSISKNAIKNRQPIYHDSRKGDPVQTGFVFSAKTIFFDENRGKWINKYIDLWVDIFMISVPNFAIS